MFTSVLARGERDFFMRPKPWITVLAYSTRSIASFTSVTRGALYATAITVEAGGTVIAGIAVPRHELSRSAIRADAVLLHLTGCTLRARGAVGRRLIRVRARDTLIVAGKLCVNRTL